MADAVLFYPKGSGMTKQEVVDMITDRFNEGDLDVREPDLNKLTDERMQKFVDEWHEAFEDSLDIGPETACEEQEKVLKELAQEIQNVEVDES